MKYTLKIKYLLVSFSFIIFQHVVAQTDDDIGYRHCATFEYNKALQAKHPGYKTIKQVADADKVITPGNNFTAIDSIFTIPVVFHILYNKNSENIPDEQIISQIDVLNEDYSGTNLDIVNVPDAFKHAKANDIGIRFCLATLDPDNNATNGVIRVPTTITEFDFADDVKSTAAGGDDAWPTDQYLNVWVCNLGGSLLGYATYPGSGADSTDGVVVFYKAVGRNGTAVKPYNKGRTLTHEVGHWLNLYHIWGDDPSDCSGSDMVSDTPNQDSSTFGCPSYPQNSCNNATAGGNMYMNYLDYTNDSCMCLFTAGQKKRMMHALDSLRPALKLSKQTNCAPLDPKPDYSVLIVPNPNNGNFMIRFKKTIPENFELSMYDMFGHIVYETKITGIDTDIETGVGNRNIPVQCDNLAKGIYFLRTNTEGHAYNYKVVIFKN